MCHPGPLFFSDSSDSSAAMAQAGVVPLFKMGTSANMCLGTSWYLALEERDLFEHGHGITKINGLLQQEPKFEVPIPYIRPM